MNQLTVKRGDSTATVFEALVPAQGLKEVAGQSRSDAATADRLADEARP